MTREEAIGLYIDEDSCCQGRVDVIRLINYIFDEHEKELKQSYIDGSNSNNELIKFYLKHIEELEELIKPKMCDDCMFDYCGCSVQDSILRADNTATFETFCCNRFKQKDNA